MTTVDTPAQGAAGGAEAAAAALGPEHVEYLLRLGDNALVLGQRLSEWCGHGPVLEEDLALTNIALDLIGQARLLLSHAARLEARGRDEDALAYFRDEQAFRNWTLLELPNGEAKHDDYAVTVARNFLHSALMVELWQALAGSTDPQLAAIAAKSLKEARSHLRHSADWMIRFGDGTEDSHARAQAALDRLWPYTNEFWAADPVEQRAAANGIGVSTAALKPAWDQTVDAVLAEACLKRPADSNFVSTGKLGRHSEFLGYLLAEMQSLARQHPGATW
ncbi:MAG: phenylacetate-CoA oxygenase subunit PaaC [Burkholderiales bacterium]|nr:MAG: phenylacetate-CoA oxygenase subunit PaaC [Burkholderiales bacterium]